jgi:hypothetical protein
MDPVVVYVPSCVQNGSESLGLKVLEDFDVRVGGCPLELNSIGPYVFEYCFVLIVWIFFRVAGAYVSLLFELISLDFSVLCPCQSSVELKILKN